MTTMFERRIALAGASNFRDLGGYATEDGKTVRWRKVFRSDALQDLTPEDASLLVGLGLGDVFDLRTTDEIEMFGTNPLGEHGVRHHHVPFNGHLGPAHQRAASVPDFDDHVGFADMYLTMLAGAGPSVARVFTHLAEGPEQAIVFHCAGGRDRTGMTAALLLGALGVSRETIEADYELTGQYLMMPAERLERMRALYGDRPWNLKPGPLATPPEVIRLTLQRLDAEYGSPEAYLAQSGVTADHIAALRRNLLEG